MIFKGRTYRKAPMHTVISWGDGFTLFGKVVPQGKPCPPNGVALGRNWKERDPGNLKWRDTGEPVYAVPVLCIGHSRTNLSYGADGRMYLAVNGFVYTSHYKMSEDAKRQALDAKQDLRADDKLNPGNP